MIIPIRCFTCGKVIANNWNKFTEMKKQGESEDEVLTKLGYSRYCCRRMFITHVDLIDTLIHYK